MKEVITAAGGGDTGITAGRSGRGVAPALA
jgi:hypothetical protein